MRKISAAAGKSRALRGLPAAEPTCEKRARWAASNSNAKTSAKAKNVSKYTSTKFRVKSKKRNADKNGRGAWQCARKTQRREKEAQSNFLCVLRVLRASVVDYLLSLLKADR